MGAKPCFFKPLDACFAQLSIDASQSLAESLGLLDVSGRVLVHALDFLLPQAAHETRGRSDYERSGFYGLSLGHETARTDDGVFADHRAVENDGSHADKSSFFDGASVQDGGVADSDVFLNDAGVAELGVHDGVVLDIAADADRDGFQVSSKHGAGPDADAVLEFHGADYLRRIGRPGGKRDLRNMVFKCETRHNRKASEKSLRPEDCTQVHAQSAILKHPFANRPDR